METLQLLDGHIDIYLPDYKYYSSYYAGLYSHAEDYREFAVPAIDEMVRQTGAPQFDKNGLLKRGTVIRHLMLPGLAGDTAQVLRDIASRWGDSVLVSLMRQYTPFDMQDYPELDRTITAEEYADACTLFGELGLGGFFSRTNPSARVLFPPLTAQDWRKINMKTVLSIAGTDRQAAQVSDRPENLEAPACMAWPLSLSYVHKIPLVYSVCSRFPLNWLANRLTVCLTIFSRMPSRSACCMTQRLFTQ